MLLALPRILEDNQQLTIIVIGLAIAVILGIILIANIANANDKHKEKKSARLDAERQGEKIIDRVERRSKVASKEKKIQQVKRETRDPRKKAEEEAASKNTLLGGKSEAQREEKEAREVFGSLGISSKKAEEIDKAKEQIIINGYLQKSNTAPIRPVYSNTLEARQQQKKELDSDVVGSEAETPALVMDSAAPSEVKITEAPVQKVKPTALKRPTASRVAQADAGKEAEEADTTYSSAMRPQLGTEVSNAEIDRVAEVQAEKPEILKQGEEAIIPAAEKPVEGFVPSKELAEEMAEEQAGTDGEDQI
ncbi:MAG: hypothetical protein IJL19_10460 [Clostridiales bacterium]|nr:hypothetical protein [Clostridiales bacterium]